jgi:predicted component of type VI protein secretion system
VGYSQWVNLGLDRQIELALQTVERLARVILQFNELAFSDGQKPRAWSSAGTVNRTPQRNERPRHSILCRSDFCEWSCTSTRVCCCHRRQKIKLGFAVICTA